MTRKNKIEILKAIAAGKADIYDLAAGDGWFVKFGGFYIGDEVRYTEEHFEKIKDALKRQGREPFVLDSGCRGESKWLDHIKIFSDPHLKKPKEEC